MSVPKIEEELALIRHEDQSLSINWWPHLVYRTDRDEIERREDLARDEAFSIPHGEYLKNGL